MRSSPEFSFHESTYRFLLFLTFFLLWVLAVGVWVVVSYLDRIINGTLFVEPRSDFFGGVIS